MIGSKQYIKEIKIKLLNSNIITLANIDKDNTKQINTYEKIRKDIRFNKDCCKKVSKNYTERITGFKKLPQFNTIAMTYRIPLHTKLSGFIRYGKNNIRRKVNKQNIEILKIQLWGKYLNIALSLFNLIQTNKVLINGNILLDIDIIKNEHILILLDKNTEVYNDIITATIVEDNGNTEEIGILDLITLLKFTYRGSSLNETVTLSNGLKVPIGLSSQAFNLNGLAIYKFNNFVHVKLANLDNNLNYTQT